MLKHYDFSMAWIKEVWLANMDVNVISAATLDWNQADNSGELAHLSLGVMSVKTEKKLLMMALNSFQYYSIIFWSILILCQCMNHLLFQHQQNINKKKSFVSR